MLTAGPTSYIFEHKEVPVGVKTGRSRVGGPKLCVMDRWVTEDRDTMFIQVRALLMEAIPYYLLD